MEERLDIEALRERLNDKTGQDYWQSLSEVAGTDAFRDFLHREFPKGAAEWRDEDGRRHFLKIMGASLALAGLGGCVAEDGEKIVPYVQQPEKVVPGEATFFATAATVGGFARGVLAESHEGRPTKLEGNPDHPASLGASDALTQAAVLDLYDPDRSTNVLRRGQPSAWDTFTTEMNGTIQRFLQNDGAGLRLLTGPFTSPTLERQINDVLRRFPQARWQVHDPTGGALSDTRPVYHLDEADVIVSLGSDFLMTEPGSVRYARDFADGRRVREGEAEMNRLYAVESAPTTTGLTADHRLPLPPHRVQRFALALASRVGASAPEAEDELSDLERTYLDAMASDLQNSSAVVVAGETQPASVRALARRINQAVGATGAAVEYIESPLAQPEQDATLRDLTREIENGEVDTLLMMDANPAYTAPANVDFQAALEQVPTSVHHGLFVDETGYRSTWHVPKRHVLETWSDARAFDGTASIVQPLIRPLYDAAHSRHELLSVFTEGGARTSYDVVTAHWNERFGGDAADGDFASFWQQALHDGLVPEGSTPGGGRFSALPDDAIPSLAAPGRQENAQPDTTAAGGDSVPAPADTTIGTQQSDTTSAQPDTSQTVPVTAPSDGSGELELILKPGPFMRDGEHANNAWLQETPKPVTKLVWDNAALLSPSTAEDLGVEKRDMLRLRFRGNTLEAPAWIVPGHADDCVTLYLGYGRERAGRVGDDVGFDAYRLRTSDAPWGGPGLSVEKTGEEYELVSTQHHWTMEDRETVREGSLEEFRENPGFPTEGAPIELPSLYEEYEYDDYKWGMVIDNTVCTGCQACVTACQSENNIPVVGKEQVGMGREMHWIRVDRYFKGTLDNPSAFHQPTPCMHCEKAPCEVVCPVNATVHDEEGLNVMVYNRCIGTRYCSNNCPYKVRRFNFLEYNEGWGDDNTTPLEAQHNPDVTVRSRGVMEKCTYCIQRISAARIEAKKDDREIEDGEILTACQQACPTRAITFGDLNDDSAKVKHLEEQPHNYALLEELGTRPRTTYLAHLTNPNEELRAAIERRNRQRGISPSIGEEEMEDRG
jgi:molybdopterin-containing oxidoreductase family iron-sulfur binding subunit